MLGIIFIEQAIARLKQHNPKIKIIVILRNPVDRAYSGFLFAKWQGIEYLDSFEEAIKLGPSRFNDELSKSLCSYLERGYYDIQIKRLLQYFPKDQIKFILQEDLITNGKETLKNLF